MRGHYYDSIDGWFDFEDVYREAVRAAKDGDHLVEVGCWQGKSLSFLAVEALNSGKRLTIDGVDNWRGSDGEPYQCSLAEATDVMEVCRRNVARSGYPVNLVRADSAAAAALYPDRGLDFVFIDAAHDYLSVTRDLRAWMPKVKWGGTLAGHDYVGGFPEVALAVRDFVPLGEIAVRGSCWLYRRAVPESGRWLRPPPPGLDWLLFVPHVNRADLLEESLAGVSHVRERVVLIDQSAEGVPEGLWPGAVFRWLAPRRFTAVQNWIIRQAQRRRLWAYGFMHSDAVCLPGAVEAVVGAARDLDAAGEPWGVVFTQYDVLCLFNAAAAQAVGVWDESFEWYVSDVDFYNRLRWGGWPPHTVAGDLVRHRESQTLRALPAEERARVSAHHAWSLDHYAHKWGCRHTEGDGRACAVPYGGRP